jgi:2-polyprenyl-3-methyl-5-hydroxy-6-metoxy-1,4-benzoquinol methylase
MRDIFFDILRCPTTGQKLKFIQTESADNLFRNGWLVSEDNSMRYPIKNDIPRFVPESNYAENFGFQWNIFSKTQLDSYSGHPISFDRFWKATGWNPDEMKDKWVLDIGCGAGRFAEIALSTGANVVALDYSSAVDACNSNIKHPNLHIIQADIYALPFLEGTFSYVYSLGVLQHTPNVSKAFFSLPKMLTSGGKICVDFYEKSWKSLLLPKYWIRPITKKISKQTLFDSLKKSVPFMLDLSNKIGLVPYIGKFLKRLIPVANYNGVLPLNEKQLKEWALLDTFDWLSPAYDNPQSYTQVNKMLNRSGLINCEILRAGHLVARATKI